MTARWLPVLSLAALLAACAQPPREGTLVVVLEDADGGVGQVEVRRGADTLALDTANAAASIDTAGGIAGTALDAAAVETSFGAALAARPVPPHDFILYFVLDSDELTPESQAAFEDVFDDVRSRRHFEVTVIGHTDTLADADHNRELALRRAEQIQTLLIERGVPAASITAFGRGENDLLVPTADSVSEPSNRRVEVVVR